MVIKHGDSGVLGRQSEKLSKAKTNITREKLLCVSLAGLIMGGQVMKKHPLNDDQLCGQ